MQKTIVCSDCQLPFEVVGSVEPSNTTREETIAAGCIECGKVNHLEWPTGAHYLVRRAE